MKYYTLYTQPIDNKIIQNVSEKILIKSLANCYKNAAFSTFPYIIDNLNSREAIHKYKCGDCVALSMYVQEHLANNYGIKGYLIPATIPNKYKYPEYLDISHVALAIPKNKDEIYIVDPAFYFLNPIMINMKKNTIPIVYSKNIYKYESSNQLKNYTSIDKVESHIFTNPKKKIFNAYQSIPANTLICKCNYTNDKNDTWMYILREVINPDRAITTTFINTRKKPFICATSLDINGLCTSIIYLKKINNDKIMISRGSKPSITYNKKNLPGYINDLSMYFGDDTHRYLFTDINDKIIFLYNDN